MKGPSLEAIRRFKEQQERKKQEEDEKRLNEKISTLEHRAAQGDRKAKQGLKRIEQKSTSCTGNPSSDNINSNIKNDRKIDATKGNKPPQTARRKQPAADLDFEELMRLAKNNNNQPKAPKPQRPAEPSPERKPVSQPQRSTVPAQRPIISNHRPAPPSRPVAIGQQPRPRYPPMPVHQQPSTSRPRQVANIARMRVPLRRDAYDDDGDDYEQDDFVVDDDEEDVQDEISKTIRSVFKYDKRRCDLREEELDRQYRAIGRVNTFEDLEREERRASRLAAAEDAKALREEEERKRLKKARLKG